MNKLNFTSKSNGDILNASEWNSLVEKTDEIVDAVNNGGSGAVSTEADPTDADKTFLKVGDVLIGELTAKGEKGTNVGISGDNNINIEPRAAAGTGEGKNTPGLADRKGGNIAFKPGDDIEFWAHHRGTSKNDEVSIKILTEVPKVSDPTKTDEVAAKLQLNTADIVLTSKDKAEDSSVMNVTVNKAANTRGYLKVRAQAIDLRCEENGGIALQPKGQDSGGKQNKIKFEHGGGDGLEFGTFNTEKTSLYTNEYRFKKNGIWKSSTRNTEVSDKYDGSDETTHYKYIKQSDDFYDIVNGSDDTTTTERIITTAKALNPSFMPSTDTIINTYSEGGSLIMRFGTVYEVVDTPSAIEDAFGSDTIDSLFTEYPNIHKSNTPATVSFKNGRALSEKDIDDFYREQALLYDIESSDIASGSADLSYDLDQMADGDVMHIVFQYGGSDPDIVGECFSIKKKVRNNEINMAATNVYINGVDFNEMAALFEELKEMKTNNQGPWEGSLL